MPTGKAACEGDANPQAAACKDLGEDVPAAVESAFDVAFWFADMALDENEYLQPQKLHRLLFLAQAYYAVANSGRRLMPAVFVAEEFGPIEPGIYKAFVKGRPNIDVDLILPEDVDSFLKGIWRRFGRQSTERLTRITNETAAYRQALKRGRRAEIGHDSIRRSFAAAREAPALDQVLKPKVLRSQTGRPVAVRAWVPGTRPRGGI